MYAEPSWWLWSSLRCILTQGEKLDHHLDFRPCTSTQQIHPIPHVNTVHTSIPTLPSLSMIRHALYHGSMVQCSNQRWKEPYFFISYYQSFDSIANMDQPLHPLCELSWGCKYQFIQDTFLGPHMNSCQVFGMELWWNNHMLHHFQLFMLQGMGKSFLACWCVNLIQYT